MRAKGSFRERLKVKLLGLIPVKPESGVVSVSPLGKCKGAGHDLLASLLNH